MAENINYQTAEKIIEFNVLALIIIKAKKADSAEVLSKSKILMLLDECETKEGDIYDKALVLLKGIIQKHPFASGNRRTAFIVTKEFLIINQKEFNIEDDPIQARAMQGIRENYYTNNEIKEWIKNGKIREFKRS